MATTEYERQRDARIRSNNAVMEKLGINGLVPAGLRAPKGAKSGSTHRKRARATVPEESLDRRRSSRLTNQAAIVYTTFEEDDDLGDNNRGAKRRQTNPEVKARRPAVHPAPGDGEVRRVVQNERTRAQEAHPHRCANRLCCLPGTARLTRTCRLRLRAAPWA